MGMEKGQWRGGEGKGAEGQKWKGGLEGNLEQGRRLAKAGPGYRQ